MSFIDSKLNSDLQDAARCPQDRYILVAPLLAPGRLTDLSEAFCARLSGWSSLEWPPGLWNGCVIAHPR
jgi:hypothetical protein